MQRQSISLLLIGLILNLAFYSSARANVVDAKIEKEAKFAQKVKSEIAKLGVGKESQVNVKLKDGAKLKGYVIEINDDNFVVVDNSDQSNTIHYSGVKQIKGKNNLNGTTVALVVGAFVLIALLVWGVSGSNP